MRLIKLFLLSLACLAWLVPNTAQASWVLTAKETGGPSANLPNAGPQPDTGPTGDALGTYRVGDFTITPIVVDYQDTGYADLSLTSLDLNNNSSHTETLTLTLVDSAFTMPGGPGAELAVNSNLTEVSQLGTDKLQFQTFVNGTPVTPSAQVLTGPGFNFSPTYSFFRGASYSVKNVTTITLSGGGHAFLFEEGASFVTPEPASLTLALSGLGAFFGFPLWKRRRQRP